jgi:hypothetical protein
MASRKLYSLYVDLFENGFLKDIRDFTDDQRDAIYAEIEELWMDHYRFEAHRNEFIIGLNREEDAVYLLYRKDGQQAAFPDDCMLREITVGAPKVNQETLKLIGDRIPLRLPGYPATRVYVQFADV